MDDLNKAISDAAANAMANLVDSGKLAAMIEEQIAKTTAAKISDQLGQYSDFGKQVEASVKAMLQVDPGQLGLAGYNHTVLQILRQQINAHLETTGAQKIAENMAKLLEGATCQDIKLTDLVREFLVWAHENRRNRFMPTYHDEASIIVTPNEYMRNSWCIGLDVEPRRASYYNCAFVLCIDEHGKLYGASIEGFDTSKSIFAQELHGFPRRIFQLHATGARLIVTPEEVDAAGEIGWADVVRDEECRCD